MPTVDEHLTALGYGDEESDEDDEIIGVDVKGVRFEGEGDVYEINGAQFLADLLVLEDGTKFSVPSRAAGFTIAGIDVPYEEEDE